MMINNEIEYFPESATFHGSIPLIMGTRFDMIAFGHPEKACRQLWDWVCAEVQRLDGMLNRFAPESELSKVNGACGMPNYPVSHELGELIRIAKYYWNKTDGLFDITKGNMSDVSIDEKDRLTLKGRNLDFGGFAKGFFLKELKSEIASAGVGTAFVDFGDSSIMGIGHHPFGDCWKVGVKDPFGGAVLGEIELRNQTMSTSGNTPIYSSHIVNPKTGEANNQRIVATVVSDDPLDAEVLSTAAVIADPVEIEAMKKNFPNAEFHIFRSK